MPTESNISRPFGERESIQVTLPERDALWRAFACHLAGEMLAWTARRIGRNQIGFTLATCAFLAFGRAQTLVTKLTLAWAARASVQCVKP